MKQIETFLMNDVWIMIGAAYVLFIIPIVLFIILIKQESKNDLKQVRKVF